MVASADKMPQRRVCGIAYADSVTLGGHILQHPIMSKVFLPLLIAAFACVIGVLSLGLSETSGRWPGSVVVLVIGFCLFEAVFSLRNPVLNSRTADAPEVPHARWKTLFLTLCAAAIAALLGLLTAIVVFVMAHSIWIGATQFNGGGTDRRADRLILYGFFEQGLGVRLFRGMWF